MPNSGSRFTMPDAFWPSYLRRHSIDRPFATPRPFPGALVTPGQVFDVFVAAAELVRRRVPCLLRLFLGDRTMVRRLNAEQLGTKFWEVLPRSEDASLTGYGERLEQRHGYACFGIVLNESHSVMPEIWFRMREFLRGLYEETGFPLGGTDVNIFAGNYCQTPFGVHRDGQDIFTWVVEGRKKFLLWPEESFPPSLGRGEAEGDPFDYEAHRGRATVLEGNAGDMLYWPKSYWHVAESNDDGLVTTLSIGLRHRVDPSWVKDALASMAGAADSSSHHAFATGALAKSARTLPKSLSSTLDVFGKKSTNAALRRQIHLRWLCHLTGFGLAVPPQAERAPLSAEDRVRVEPRYPIQCVAWRRELLCSANGYGFSTADRKSIARLVAELNSGRELSVDELCKKFSSGLSLATIRALLGTFAAYRALQRV